MELLSLQERLAHEPFTPLLQTKYYRLLKNPRWHLTGRIKIPEIEDGVGPLDQDPAREHGYHPTMESLPIKKKRINIQ